MADYKDRVFEQVRGWPEKAREVPFIKFPADWEIRMTPPFAGADARFAVRKDGAFVSAYLDFDSNLGCMDDPYWEIHPIDGDCARYLLHETDDLLAGIALSIKQQTTQEAAP